MIGRPWRGGRGGRDEIVSSLRRKRDEFVASRAGDPRVPTQSLVSRFCLTFPGRPRFEALLVRKGASSSLVVDIRESGYTVHVAEWLRRQSKVLLPFFTPASPRCPGKSHWNTVLDRHALAVRERPTRALHYAAVVAASAAPPNTWSRGAQRRHLQEEESGGKYCSGPGREARHDGAPPPSSAGTGRSDSDSDSGNEQR